MTDPSLCYEFQRYRLTRPAQIFLTTVLLLTGLGLVVMFSASTLHGQVMHGDIFHYLIRQGQGVALGIIALIFAAHVRPEFWLRVAVVLFLFAVASIIAVFPFSESVYGAKRWIRYAGVGYQPSELIKFTVPLMIAWCLYHYPSLHRPQEEVRKADPETRATWERERGSRVFLRLGQLILLAFVAGLIALEPDYGSAAFITAVAITLLLVTRLPWTYVALGFFAMIPAVIYLILKRSEELVQRFDGLLAPERVDQVWHSLLGIGSGGWTGVGLGNGVGKAHHIPEVYNDFVFAVVGEETGFLGVFILIVLLSLVLQSGWRVVRECPHPALRILGLGIVLNLVAQAIANIAVATASAPTKGIGLPFVSYGSTSLSIVLLQAGILIGISKLEATGERRA